MRYFKLLAGVAILAAALVGCSNDDNGTNPPVQLPKHVTEWNDSDSTWTTTLQADGERGSYSYYSFADRNVVGLTDAQAKSSTDWDIAFKKSYVKTNGGVSGNGSVKAVDLTVNGIVAADAFAEVGSAQVTEVESGKWMTDVYDFALDSLWNIDSGTLARTPKQYVYILSDAMGNMVKFQLLSMIGGQPSQQGAMVLKYFYQSNAASTALDGVAEVDTIDAAGGFYFDFSSDQVVTPTDPTNSKDWDIRIYSYDIYLNGSVFGPGSAAAFPVYDGLSDRTDFDAVTDVNQFGPPRWVADEMMSAFTATDWYNYNFSTHVLTSKMNTYLVQVGGKTYKVEIVSYYDPETQASATFTFHWAEL
ncbi:MAG: HmuY family protein [Candidatus Zixiibacteriota bacterium]